MKTYRLINNLGAWACFLIAFIIYLLTVEPTASFWDCGEFIATAYKLQVGHPPGAPLFMMLGRVFSLFAFGDLSRVALMVNMVSVLASAFTILFLFWTITILAKRLLVKKDSDLSSARIIVIMAAGAIGALAYAVSDSFWFSAVEAEVYATSSLFTAVVFWAILKWEAVADQPFANRWIILIAYLMGLSIGVHLLNLLVIPAIVFVYYFRKYETSRRGVIISALLAIGILLLVQYGIVQGLVWIASKFELLFVNSFGLSFYSGIVFFAILLLVGIFYGLYYSHKHHRGLMNMAILAFTVIVIGYSSYAMIVIRSLADPPIDENNPETVFSLLAYLNREQYGDRPLLHGQYYNAPRDSVGNGKAEYVQRGDRYDIVDYRPKYYYDSDFTTIFPRMYSSQGGHIRYYRDWGEVEDDRNKPPTFANNLLFFMKYQVGHMYLRYFLWNFSGRQNDDQGHGNYFKGNFMTGIPFFDSLYLGPQKELPDDLAQHPSRNRYFLFPLILGVLGLFTQYKCKHKDFFVTLLFFFFTGLAIVLYLNQTPIQPRERDYAYVGSFYVFAIWIGLGVLRVWQWINKKLAEKQSAIVAGVLCLLLVPVIMGFQNWDDHDRSGRYTARDLAKNYLASCAPGAILFTYGDNDTFPLWYVQEVEGYRTDVRVVNLSLLSSSWYAGQMMRRAYDSPPVPHSLTAEEVGPGERDVVIVFQQGGDTLSAQQAIDFVKDTMRVPLQNGDSYHFIPTNKFYLPVDKQKVLQSGLVDESMRDSVVDRVEFQLDKHFLYRSDLMMLDIVANSNWERPVYFAGSIGVENFLGLADYLRLEGFAYRLVPYKTPSSSNGLIGHIDSKLLYERVMERFVWGRMNAPDVHLCEQNLRVIELMGIRELFARLALTLVQEGDNEKAIAVVDRCMELLPMDKVKYDEYMTVFVQVYFAAKADRKAKKLLLAVEKKALNKLNYHANLPERFRGADDSGVLLALRSLQELGQLSRTYGQAEDANRLEKELKTYYPLYERIARKR